MITASSRSKTPTMTALYLLVPNIHKPPFEYACRIAHHSTIECESDITGYQSAAA